MLYMYRLPTIISKGKYRFDTVNSKSYVIKFRSE